MESREKGGYQALNISGPVAELADALDLGSSAARRVGSSPIEATSIFKVRCNMVPRIDIEEIRKYIREQGPNTKIYLGVDSERVMRGGLWYADYILVVVVHKNSRNGCHLFGEVIRERDYDQKKNKPRLRLVTEAYKVAELYIRLEDVLKHYEVEVHLDINSDDKHFSNQVVAEAVGYVKGVCPAVEAVRIKPQAFAASYAADRLKEFLDRRRRRDLGEAKEDDLPMIAETA